MKMYVLVRDDLKSQAYKAVQACHAVAEFVKTKPLETAAWNNTLVLLTVRSERQLERYADKFKDCVVFREPDIGDEATALAVVGDFRINLPLL